MTTDVRLLTAIAAVLFACAALGLKCNSGAPSVPEVSGPTEVYQRASTWVDLVSVDPQGRPLYYVVDWGDGNVDTSSALYLSGDTARMYHAFVDSGIFGVRGQALVEAEQDFVSEWSDPHDITVHANGTPGGAEFRWAEEPRRGMWRFFELKVVDPDGDSWAYKWSFGDWSGWFPSGTWVRDSWYWANIETLKVWFLVKDRKGVEGDTFSFTLVGQPEGVLLDYFIDNLGGHEGWYITSPVIADAEGEMRVFGALDIPPRYQSFSVYDDEFKKKGYASIAFPRLRSSWVSHGAYIRARANHVAGADDGELYAMSPTLDINWRYPGVEEESLLTYIPWGAPAVNGGFVYCARDNDSLYWLEDRFNSVELKGIQYVQGIGEATVIDAEGHVYAVSDQGWLYRFQPDLSGYAWRVQLATPYPVAVLGGPVLGVNGDVFVTVGEGTDRVFCCSGADGAVRWSAPIDGWLYSMVVGVEGLYVQTNVGKLHAFDIATGILKWEKQVTSNELVASPALSANGFIYLRDDEDILYCVNRADGTLEWSLDCFNSGPGLAGRTRRPQRDLDLSLPSLTIHPNGDIIVPGENALYLVKGYSDGPLDNAAPWPKWQYDIYNSGRADDR